MAGVKKATLADVAARLSERQGVSRREALALVESVFETLRDGLKADGFVKASGLGTFKVVEMAERESVSVRTGERILIEAHERIGFSPDGALKQRVGKAAVTAVETEAGEKEDGETEKMLEVHCVEIEGTEEQAVQGEVAESERNEERGERSEERGRRKKWKWRTAGMVVLLLVCVVAGYMIGKRATGGELAAAEVENEDTTATIEPQEEAVEPTVEQLAAEYAQVDGGKWLIVGTIAEHVMEEGEGLQKVSDEIFRHPDYLRYVMVHNGLSQADVVPVGKNIKFPKLVAREE